MDSLASRAIDRTSLADQIVRYLRETIVRGELAPGTRIIEKELAQQMGTSQAPVREALQRLEQDGLVTRQSRSATYVTDISMDEMHEIALVRTTVEELAIRHTAKCITPTQCDELEKIVQKMLLVASANEMAELSAYDLEFHRRICEWSGKGILLRVWEPLYYQWQRWLIKIHPRVFPDLTEVARLHQLIVDVLRTGDPDAAAQIVKEHILLFWEKIKVIPERIID